MIGTGKQRVLQHLAHWCHGSWCRVRRCCSWLALGSNHDSAAIPAQKAGRLGVECAGKPCGGWYQRHRNNTFPAIALVALAACRGASPTELDSTGRAYRLTHSPGVELADDSGTAVLTMPPGSVAGYLLSTPVGADAGQVTVTLEVTGDPAWETPTDAPPAQATLMLQRWDDGCECTEWGRMWAGGSRVRLTPGVHVLTAPLDWRAWSGVWGKSDPAAFAAVLSHLGSVAVSFGGASFFGHGAAAVAPVTVRVTVEVGP